MTKKFTIFLAMSLIFLVGACGSKEKKEVSERKKDSREFTQGNPFPEVNSPIKSGSNKPEDKKKPLLKKSENAKLSKVSNNGDDDLSNLPISEAKTLVKRYIELSLSVPDSDERKEMEELLSTISSFGPLSSSVIPALAKHYIVLSNSVPDSDERKEMYCILNTFSRLGSKARSISTILTNRYRELSESIPDNEEKKEMTLILQTTARIK